MLIFFIPDFNTIVIMNHLFETIFCGAEGSKKGNKWYGEFQSTSSRIMTVGYSLKGKKLAYFFWYCISSIWHNAYNIYKAQSEVAQSCPTLCYPMDGSLPGSGSMGFSRQEYWSGLPFPSPGDLPNPGIEPGSPALQTDALLSEPLGRTYNI